MRVEEKNGYRYQYADKGKWLTKSESKDQRDFTESVMLPKGAALWDEWTNAKKVKWEEEHGILPIIEDAQIVKEETNTIE